MSIQTIEISQPKARKPRSLFQFLTWAGGLKPDPELSVLLDGKHGWMIRKSGMSLDDARIACIEEGFWSGSDESNYEPSINDLLELIAAEAAGHKQYRAHEALDAHDWDQRRKAGRRLQAPPHASPAKPSEGKTSEAIGSHNMTADEYKKLRIKLGLTGDQMARELGISPRMQWYYELGDREIPYTIVRLLRLLAKHGLS